MNFNRFRLNIAIRVLVLFVSIWATVLLFQYFKFYVSGIIGVVMVCLQTYLLFRYADKINDDLKRFFTAIRYDDFTQSFSKGPTHSTLDALYKSFNEVFDSYRQIRKESAERQQFLFNVLQHIGIGLLAYKQDGSIEISNLSAKRILRAGKLKHLNDIPNELIELREMIRDIRNGEQLLFKSVELDNPIQLTIVASEFRIREQNIKLVSLQNIQRVLEEKELEAWQNLTRVLNHEIMNSITPIVSLAGSAISTIEDLKDTGYDEEIGDIKQAIKTIEKRSESLLKFVNQYRNLTHIPRPSYKLVKASEILENIRLLFKQNIQDKNILFEMAIQPADLRFMADPEMIEQVLINLVLNSIDAVKNTEEPCIFIKAQYNEESRIEISVTDNGSGIEKEALDKIFIPFFTTKKSGSGIGLSLSRQVMRLHGGNISAYSKPNEQTVFKLTF